MGGCTYKCFQQYCLLFLFVVVSFWIRFLPEYSLIHLAYPPLHFLREKIYAKSLTLYTIEIVKERWHHLPTDLIYLFYKNIEL